MGGRSQYTDAEIQSGLEGKGYTSVQKVTDEFGDSCWTMLDGGSNVITFDCKNVIREIES